VDKPVLTTRVKAAPVLVDDHRPDAGVRLGARVSQQFELFEPSAPVPAPIPASTFLPLPVCFRLFLDL